MSQVPAPKVFISYYHEDDQEYKDRLVQALDSKAIDKSVSPGDIHDASLPLDEIRRADPRRTHRRRHGDNRPDRPMHLAAQARGLGGLGQPDRQAKQQEMRADGSAAADAPQLSQASGGTQFAPDSAEASAQHWRR